MFTRLWNKNMMLDCFRGSMYIVTVDQERLFKKIFFPTYLLT